MSARKVGVVAKPPAILAISYVVPMPFAPPWTVAPKRSPLESMNSWPSGSVPLPVEVGNEAIVVTEAGMSVSLKGLFTEEFRRITTSSAEMQYP